MDGVFWLEERRLVNDWGRIENRWLWFRDGRRYEKRFSVRLYSASELAALLHVCGFDHVTIYGGLDGIPYDSMAKRLVVMAHRVDRSLWLMPNFWGGRQSCYSGMV